MLFPGIFMGIFIVIGIFIGIFIGIVIGIFIIGIPILTIGMPGIIPIILGGLSFLLFRPPRIFFVLFHGFSWTSPVGAGNRISSPSLKSIGEHSVLSITTLLRYASIFASRPCIFPIPTSHTFPLFFTLSSFSPSKAVRKRPIASVDVTFTKQ